MNEWSSGYVSDIPYTAVYYHDQSPANLNFICLLNGFLPRRLDEGFHYLELGCGCGLTTNLLAAANPLGKFYAVDFQPSHIAEAMDLAAAARLENVTFYEQSFGAFLERTLTELPSFDFITLHGVYSWISPRDRQRIVAIIDRGLKPGGIVYISYNSLPGWSTGQPIQRLLYELGQLVSGRSDERFEKALSLLEDIRNEKSPILSRDELFDRICDIRDSGRLRYLTHEYMTGNWHPLYHADVARDLSAAKLTFIGSSNALDNFPDLNFTESRQTLLSNIGNPELKETIKDYLVPRLLRKDVFVRGPRRLSTDRQEALLNSMGLALIVPSRQTTLDLKVPIGKVTVSESIYTPVLEFLAERPRSLAELLTASGPHAKPGEKAAEIAGILIGTWQAAPIVSFDGHIAKGSVKRFNSAMADQALIEDVGRLLPLASPIIGSGIQASGLEIQVFQAVLNGSPIRSQPLSEHIWQSLAARGERLSVNGTPLETEEENIALLLKTIETVIDQKLPVWQNLGIL